MTLITNEIHMLDGFKKTVLIFAADRRLPCPDGSYGSTRPKLFPIPYLEGGVSYFGFALVFPKGKRQYLSDWLQGFIDPSIGTPRRKRLETSDSNSANIHSIAFGGVHQNIVAARGGAGVPPAL